jgi:amino acid adenylation domain-containing protein/natural product biosynthesis luciferase-like monooxygenase protein
VTFSIASPLQLADWPDAVRHPVATACLLRIAPDLAPERIASALGDVWASHEALRCRLVMHEAQADPVLETLPAPAAPAIAAAMTADRARDMLMELATAPVAEGWHGDVRIVPLAEGGALVLARARSEMMDPESWQVVADSLAARLSGAIPEATAPLADVAGWLSDRLPHALADNAAHPGARTGRIDVPDRCAAPLAVAWAGVLGRFLGKDCVALDIHVPYRGALGLDGAVGCYRAPRRLSVSVPADEPLTDRLLSGEVHDPLADAADLSFETEEADGALSLSSPTGGAGPVEIVDATWHPGRAPVSLAGVRRNGVIGLTVGYDPSRVSTEVAENMLAAVQAFLNTLSNGDDVPLAAVDLGASAAHVAILTGQDRPISSEGLAQAVARIAQGQPDAVAVEVAGTDIRLGYADLQAASEGLAAAIAAAGIRAGTVVGIALPRSPEFLVAVLAISRLGCAFAPLDIRSPASRLEAMAVKAGIGALVADGRIELSPGGIVHIDVGARGDAALLPAVHPVPEDLAYILHTSGSTGVPKAVRLTHRGLANYLTFAAESYGMAEGGGVIANTPSTFDLSLTTLLGPLIAGQRILLVPEVMDVTDAERNLDLVAALLRDRDVTLLKTTPSYLRLLNRVLEDCMGSVALRTLVLGGEAVRRTDVVPWLTADGGSPVVINEYGPTETVVGVTTTVLTTADALSGGTPIGRPIPNTQISLRDHDGRIVPIGVSGEIWIAGAGVGLGYAGQEDDTGTRFPTNPATGERAYRTGDLARMTTRGELLLLGRLDDQIKVNGVRIEPREIELALETLGAVAAAAVVKADYDFGERMVAFISLAPGYVFDPVSTIQALATLLPPALRPTAIEPIVDWPLTANGKIDRRALGVLATSMGADRASADGAPATPEEAALSAIFARVLRKDRVGPDDDFFGIGGDSIRSIAVVGQARREGYAISVADLFQARTARKLAVRLTAASPDGEEASAEPFDMVDPADRPRIPGDAVDAYPASQLQTAMIFHNEMEGESAVYHDVFCYRLAGRANPHHMRRAAEMLVARHEVLRTTFDLGSYAQPLQIVHSDGPPILSVEDLTGLSRDEQREHTRAAFREECSTAFVPARLPLIRLRLQLLDADAVQLTMSFHHSIFDGWSDVSLLMELFAIHRALCDGRVPDQAPKLMRYRDFVALERATIRSPEARAFWAEYLRDAAPALIAKAISSDESQVGFRQIPVTIPADVSARLLARCKAEAIPLKSALFAAHARVVSGLLGRGECITAMVANGRPETEGADRAVGLFINSLPMRVDTDAASWRDLVRRIVDDEACVMPHRRMPLAEINTIAGHRRIADTLFYFTDYHQAEALAAHGFEMQDLEGHEASSFTLAANFALHPFEKRIVLKLGARDDQLGSGEADRIAALYASAVAAIAAEIDAPPILDAPAASPATVVGLFLDYARHLPDKVAIIDGDRRFTYGQLAAMARRGAARLRSMIAPGERVAVDETRSAEHVEAVLAVMLARGIYVPIDRGSPQARRAAILENAGPAVVIGDLAEDGPTNRISLKELFGGPDEPCDRAPVPDDAAYLIYTSGTTGAPKGVLVGHDALARVFAAVAQTVERLEESRWLWLSGSGFDISLLEFLFPLCVGATVVVHEGTGALFGGPTPKQAAETRISLAFFSSTPGREAYRLFLDAARLADSVGLHAVWTPERHFHDFGGPFPNPAITSAALATATRRIAIRAGSLVLPLHDPVRVAEDWAVIDTLSGGRAGIAFASGWHGRDFVLAPGGPRAFARRHETMIEGIGMIQALWRGEAVALDRGAGTGNVSIAPRPVAGRLPIWLSAAGSDKTFAAAGGLGAGVFTHLLGQNADDLRRKTGLFRDAAEATGRPGPVSLMLHTYLADSRDAARDAAMPALTRYLHSSADLSKALFDGTFDALSTEDLATVVDRRLTEYIAGPSLICGEEEALARIAWLRDCGATELACLIDFGIPSAQVLAGVEALGRLQDRLDRRSTPGIDRSLPATCARHGITHVQCTPTVLRELLGDGKAREALKSLDVLLVGGERLPEHVAGEIAALRPGQTLNMYGPTEATIWTSATEVSGRDVFVGGPLGDFRLVVADENGRPARKGEILVVGDHLARGYWRNPDETAKRFVSLDPAFGLGAARAYRTGDLARLDDAGRLVFGGRADRQVKVGGHRLELAGIEALLLAQPGVADAACMVDAADHVLAYVTPRDGSEPDPGAIRQTLAAHLPATTRPSRVEVVARLPRSPNGKLIAPGPETASVLLAVVRAPQEAGLRDAVAAIWAETLDRPSVADDDDFFASGGNSLRAMVLSSRLRERLGLRATVRTVFDYPLFGALVGALGQAPALDGSVEQDAPAAAFQASFAQKRLWTISRIAPDSAAYNDAMMLALHTDVPVGKIEATLVGLMARHEAFRTSFSERDGNVEAGLAADAPFRLAVTTADEVSSSALPPEIERDAREVAAQPFDLAVPPLFRAKLWTGTDGRKWLLICVHHIVCDGWSLANLLDEFTAGLEGLPQAGNPVSYSLGDYAAEERAALEGPRRAELLSYWREALDDLPPPLELPADHARPDVEAFTGRKLGTVLPRAVLDGVRDQAHRAGTSPFVVLFSAVSVVLARLCGQADVRIGSDVAMRQRGVPAEAVGLFVNQLVLRCRVLPPESFADLVTRNRQTVLDALDHSDLPFHELVDMLQPDRDLGRNPLYQISLNYQEAVLSADDTPRVVERLPFDLGISRLDLEINASATADGLAVELIYNDRLYRPETVARIVAALESVLQAAIDDPALPVGHLPLVSPAERAALARGFGSTDIAGSKAGPTEALRSFSQGSPAAAAIVEGDRTLSYGALEGLVEARAGALMAAGLRPGAMVATHLDRSAEIVVTILALWRVGAVYVPLDAGQPDQRLAEILGEVAPAAIIGRRGDAERLSGIAGAATILILGDLPAPRSPVRPPERTEEAAYILFTSGSTGRPKGAVVRHEGMINHLEAKVRDLDLRATDRLAQTAPLTFDISIWQFFAPLMVGGSVHILDQDTVRDPALLTDACDRAGITVIELVPSFIETLIDELARRGGALATVRIVMSTGEALSVSLCRRLFAALPRLTVVNAYGPTECSDDVTHHIMTAPPPEDATSVPIGRPIGNVRLFVMDDTHELCPLGAVGELYVSGIAVGGGYVNNSDATAAAFLPDPFSVAPGARLYRTGDLVRWNADGALEYHGRKDTQVKIRGCRIELGEIEATLDRHPFVRTSLVRVTERPGSTSGALAAYVVPDWATVERALGEALQQDREAEWRSVYDLYYRGEVRTVSAADPTFDTTGWTDSFTGGPIPAEAMEDWLGQTIERITALKPRRILEIGSGTGMVVFRLAEACERYVGLDFSAPVVESLREKLRTLRPEWLHVDILEVAAHELGKVDEGEFDLVILNSVVQYFPSVRYLAGVLEQAASKLAAGGAIYLGDLRALELQDAFHQAVAAARHPHAPAEETSRLARAALTRDKELAVSLVLFGRLAAEEWWATRKAGLATWLKSGPHDNELTRYRFDAAIRFDLSGNTDMPDERPWSAIGSPERLRESLSAGRRAGLRVTGIPNARLAGDAQASRRGPRVSSGVHVDDLLTIARDSGMVLQSRSARDPFELDAWFQPQLADWACPDRTGPVASEPLMPVVHRQVAATVDTWLAERLPAFMLPQSTTVLPELPLTRHGKTDLKALPDPWQPNAETDGAETRPLTRNETVLRGIWESLLAIRPIGTRENFFALGGDSILAIQVVSMAAKQGLRLTPKLVFSHTTVAELAAVAESVTSDRIAPPPEGACPLGPAQAELLERGLDAPHHWNQAIRLGGAALGDPDAVCRALAAVLDGQDSLRLRLVQDEGGRWHQHFAADGDRFDFRLLDPDSDLADCPHGLNAGLSLDRGPLLRAALRPGPRPELLLVAHHLVVDAVSWQTLIADLGDALLAPKTPPVLRPSATYRDWIEALVARAESGRARENHAYWMEQPRLGNAHPVAGRDMDRPPGLRLIETVVRDDLSRALAAIGRGTAVEETLAAALLFVLQDVTGLHDVVLRGESHGRDAAGRLDLSRTMGWFALEYPVRLRLPRNSDDRAAIREVGQSLRLARSRAADYAALRHYDPDPAIRESLAALPPPEIALNYLGREAAAAGEHPALYRIVGDAGPLNGPNDPAPIALELNAMFRGGTLHLYWNCECARLDPGVAELIAGKFPGALARALRASNALDKAESISTGLDLSEFEAAIAEVGR